MSNSSQSSSDNSSRVSSLLKYRFQKKATEKLPSQSSSSQSTANSSSFSLNKTPNSSPAKVVSVPDTPQNLRPSPLLTTKSKSKRLVIESDSESEHNDSPQKKTSSPWLSKNAVVNGKDVDSNPEFRNNLMSLKAMFPDRSPAQLEQAIKSTPNLDQAIDAMLAFNKLESGNKRQRQESQESNDSFVGRPSKKVCRVLDSDNDDSQGSSSDATQFDKQIQEKIDFLKEAFPDVPSKKLGDALSSHNWDVAEATEALSAQQKNVITISDDDEASNQPGPSIPALAKHKQSLKKSPKRKLNDVVLDDDDEGDDFDGEDDYDSDDSMEGDERKPIVEMMLSFFNDAAGDELACMPGCSKKKAELIVGMRPFDSWEEMVHKFCSTKSLSYAIISSCRELIRIRDVVIKLMQKCERISSDIEALVTNLTSDVSLRDGVAQIKKQPKLLSENHTLKPYQMVGLNWLRLMHMQELNGILADEMGLGKTVQAIAFLAHLLEEGDIGPHLIIVPSSTLDNWLRELKNWCPSLQVCIYYGSQEERMQMRYQILKCNKEFNVLVTSYTIATGSNEDRALFKKHKFQYAVLDEAHMLKNMSSLRYQNLMKIRVKRRLLLTGTPLQNNLVELMSLLCFVMPDMFIGKTDQLKKMFTMISRKDDSNQSDGRSSYELERIKHAKRIMKPFVLRRLKKDVLKQLPNKIERVEKCNMAFEQRELYDELILKFSNAMKQEGDNALQQNGTAMLMQLRKMANHHLLHRNKYTEQMLRKMAKLMLKEPTHHAADPQLIFEDMEVMSDFELHRLCNNFYHISSFTLDEDIIIDSGKFRVLDGLLPEMKAKGDRVLLFSQFTMMLDIIEEYMQIRDHKYIRLDGSTPVIERQELIDRYNSNPDIFVFLLSTKAGGLGINLTAANTVILHDIDFNPYNDKQAEDRCHRVGQIRDVTVIKLISENSVEEHMLRCATDKLKLEQDLTGNKKGSNAEVADILLSTMHSPQKGGKKSEMADVEGLIKAALDEQL